MNRKKKTKNPPPPSARTTYYTCTYYTGTSGTTKIVVCRPRVVFFSKCGPRAQ